MNNLKKVGLSALAGSLAMVSANAVEYTMSGGLVATFTTQNAPGEVEASNGKGIGTATDLSFNASGELDNGFTVGYFMSVDTNGALSNTSSQMTVGMGSLGSFHINNKFGAKANGIDDVTPNAVNETWDTLAVDNPSFFGAATQSGSVDYRIPAQEIMGTTVNASVTYDPNAGAGATTKGAVNSNTVSGIAYTLQLAHESGVEIGGGIENVDDDQGKVKAEGSEYTTVYIKYATGPSSMAYQEAYQNSAHGTSVSGADKEAEFWSIAYTAGDLSVSYGESSLQTKGVTTTAAGNTIELESVQASYVMGAMTLSAAMAETGNAKGVAGEKYEETQLAVSFAF